MRRRSVLLSGITGALTSAFAVGRTTMAQEGGNDLANHPIVGAWNAMTPGGPSLAVFSVDGTATFANPTTAADPTGSVIYLSASVGTWEPTGPRSIHFTATLVVTDVNGVHVGYQTNDAYPVVSEDGQSLVDDQSQAKVTIRDAAGAIVQEFATAGAPPVTGSRMGVGSPGFPAGTSGVATPTTQ